MKDASPVKFIIVGCGRIGSRHAELVASNSHCALAGMVDTRDRSLLQLPKTDAPFFPSLSAYLNSGIVADVACIATPNGMHGAQALELLDAGMHVVIEKPMTLRFAEAEQVIGKAREKDRKIFVVMQNRYSPPVKWLREMVLSGKLGRLNLVQLNCFWNRDERYYSGKDWHGSLDMDGGTLYTQFSHFIDIMYWLFGDITHIRAELWNFHPRRLTEFEDSGRVQFEFLQGGRGSLQFTTAAWDSNMESSISILSENGSIRIGGQYMDRVEYCHIKDYDFPGMAETNEANDYGTHKGSARNHGYVIRNVVDVLQGRASISTPAEEGAVVVNIIERMYQAGRNT